MWMPKSGLDGGRHPRQMPQVLYKYAHPRRKDWDEEEVQGGSPFKFAADMLVLRQSGLLGQVTRLSPQINNGMGI